MFENLPSSELTPDRKLEIALAYIRDTFGVSGAEAPNFNSEEMKERVAKTISLPHLTSIGVTEDEAMKFIEEILSEQNF